MLTKADDLLKQYNDKVKADMDDVLNPKKQEKAFSSAVNAHSKPVWKLVVAFLCVFIVGGICPLFGWFVMEAMNKMNMAKFAGLSAFDESIPWILIMFGSCFVLFIAKGVAGVLTAHITTNVINETRKDLYQNIMRKDIGWHDLRENGAGVMTSTLASDVQLMNGLSAEGNAAQIEATSALLVAIIFSAVVSWPMTLVGLAITPLIIICGTIAAKADNEQMMNVKQQEGSDDKTTEEKESQILASDSIINYKTVASFG